MPRTVAPHVRSRALRGAAIAVALGILLTGCTSPLPPHTAPVAPDGVRRNLKPDERLNIVMILTDDQWASSLAQMPNVRRLLGSHGVTFRNAFVTTSLCCPSRSSILRGQYSHHTGVLTNGGPNGGALVFKDSSTIATWLHAAGYQTSLIGKYLNGYTTSTVPPGWDDWHALAGRNQAAEPDEVTGGAFYNYELNENGKKVPYGAGPSAYSTTVFATRALEFIDRSQAPFFLYVAPTAPHLPSTPAPKDVGSFASFPAARPPSYNEADLSDKPWAARLKPVMTAKDIAHIDTNRRDALETLQAVDRMVASIVNKLRRRGDLDRTVIMFTSDNGFLYGEHRLGGKIWPYEPSIRVPMVVRVPWRTQGTTENRMVLNVDIASTFADIAGIRPGLPQDGRTMLPLLTGEKTTWRDQVLIEWLAGGGNHPSYGAIRTSRYKLIVYKDQTAELYDLTKDPEELQNVAGQAAYKTIEEDLRARLRDLLRS